MAVPVLKLVLFFLSLLVNSFLVVQGTSWCVVRSDASNQALQTALDYACGSGADCSPIQSSGLCFLPNTIQAHASYAFNSYYQRRAMAPGSCDFSGTATIAKTDPSYGSCMYPSSQRYACFSSLTLLKKLSLQLGFPLFSAEIQWLLFLFPVFY
ncbi:hypothetical protein CRYUN_Cryun36dG0035900 [Craigia yunnanensis]